MDDYRVKVGFFDHPKTIRLERALGATAVVSLLRLWDFCAQYRIEGVLSGLDNEDIAAAARWQDDADKFVDVLVRCKLLDRDANGTLTVHDWLENNPYVATKGERVARAKAAAAARWGAKTDDEQSAEHAPRMPEAQSSNAHHHNTTPPNLCCVWGEPRNKSTGDLNRQLENDLRFSISPKWFPLAERCAPYSRAEISNAIAEASKEGKPNCGLIIRILERYRNTKPAEHRARAGPRPTRSDFREATDRLKEWANEPTGVSETHDAPARLLPAKSG